MLLCFLCVVIIFSFGISIEISVFRLLIDLRKRKIWVFFHSGAYFFTFEIDFIDNNIYLIRRKLDFWKGFPWDWKRNVEKWWRWLNPTQESHIYKWSSTTDFQLFILHTLRFISKQPKFFRMKNNYQIEHQFTKFPKLHGGAFELGIDVLGKYKLRKCGILSRLDYILAFEMFEENRY